MAAEAQRTLGLRERGKQQRVERILAAAHSLLKTEPGQTLTVERIAERAGVSPATVFNLVGTREQIWAALATRSLAGIDFASLPARDPQDQARAVVDEVLRTVSKEPEVFRAMLRGWSESACLVSQEPAAALVACFDDASATAQIAPGLDHDRLARLITASLLGHVHQWAVGMIDARELRQAGQDQVGMAFAAARAASSTDTRERLRKRRFTDDDRG